VTPIRGLLNDYVADVVLGQPGFATAAPFAPGKPGRIYNPIGCLVDRAASPQVLYIMDCAYNRVLGYTWDGSTLDTSVPLVVLGQTDTVGTAANGDSGWQTFPTMPSPTATTLHLSPILSQSPAESACGGGLALDSARNLWVTDSFNHRVLRFPLSGGVRQTTADRVLGQADFTHGLANRGNNDGEDCSNNSLYLGWAGSNVFANGVAIDPTNDDVWVADTANRRVLRFAAGATTATIVLGQADFTHNASGSGLAEMGPPGALAFNLDGSKLYVCDPDNDRILCYTRGGGFTSGMAGVAFAAGITWVKPIGIAFDPNHDAGACWITDAGSGSSDGPILRLVRESDGAQLRTKEPGWGGGESCGGSIGIDTAGNIFVTDQRYYAECQLLLFKKADEGTPTTKTAFFPGTNPWYSVNFSGADITGAGMRAPKAITAIGDQLVLSSWGRVIFWNNRSTSLYTGKPADGVLAGIADVAGSGFGDLDPYVNDYVSTCADSADRYLWLTAEPCVTYPYSRVLRFDAPLVHGETPASIIGSTGLPLLGGGVVTLGRSWGIVATPGSAELWLTQQQENRAFRLRNPLGVFSASADAAVTTSLQSLIDTRQNWPSNLYAGATAVVGTAPNRWQFFIASNNATRLFGLQWRSEAAGWAVGGDPGDGLAYQILPTVDVLLGQADATTTTPNRGGAKAKNTLNLPGGIALDGSGNLWVSDFSPEAQGNARLLCYLASTVPSGNASMLYGPAADYEYPNVATWQPAFAPTGEMVVAFSPYGPAPDADDPTMLAVMPASREPFVLPFQGRFPGIYLQPLAAAKFDGSHNRIGDPDGYLSDYQLTNSLAFDKQGTLYAGDLGLNRVLVYKSPFAAPIQTPPPRRTKRDRGVIGRKTWV